METEQKRSSVLVQRSCFQCGVGVMRKTGSSTVKVTITGLSGIHEVVKPVDNFVCSTCRKKSWLFQ
jgi:hypothetical protein